MYEPRIKTGRHAIKSLRQRFDALYDSSIVGAGFFEKDEYYVNDRERYWRSLNALLKLPLPRPARILEIGGGQMALLCKALFEDRCVVGDVSDRYVEPILKAGLEFVEFNLMNARAQSSDDEYDAIVLLEVVEHLPLPAYVIFDRLKRLLKPNGFLFLTTPNLFRMRNLIRMALGIEFLDRFMLPQPGQGLGHQIEYSADHLRWQLDRAGFDIVFLEHDDLGRIGHSTKARLVRRLLAPLSLRPVWRDGLVVAARSISAKSVL